MADLIIWGGLVVTMDPARRMISDGAIAIRSNHIVAVGKADTLLKGFVAQNEIDARDCLVIPGLVDGHNHPVHFLSRGISDDMPIELRWSTRVYPFEQAATDEDTYVGALANFAAMITTGTTCFNDPGGYHVDAVARAVLDSGIRGIISRSVQDVSSEAVPVPRDAIESAEDGVDASIDLYERWNGKGDDRLRVWFALRSVYNCSDRLCTEIKKAADQRGSGVHCHLCVTEAENERSVSQWGVRSMERFRRLGLLDSNLYLVHMGAVNDSEVGWLAEHDVKVCHCPSASMLGGFGCISRGRFPEMVKVGVTISLGTDAGAVSRFLDMVRVMYLAATAHKDAKADPTVMGCYKAFEMATIDGARAVGLDSEIGSLEVGKKADVVIVDPQGSDWHPNPLSNPIANLVYSADGKSVRTVVIDGKIVMEDRKLRTVDEEILWRRADLAATSVLQRADIKLVTAWPMH